MSNYLDEQILDIVRETQYITVEELSKRLFLSVSSIRRKLAALQEKGLLIRTHGGVKSIDQGKFIPSFSYRSHINVAEKKRMARIAMQFVKDGDHIFLDGSSSCFFLPELLTKFKKICVITNGIEVLSQLIKYHIPVICTGGNVRDEDVSLFTGPITEDMIERYQVDIVFFSSTSLSQDGIVYDSYEEENSVIRKMLKHSKKKVLLCDSTKIEKNAPCKVCSLEDVDIVISDQNISNQLEEKYKNKVYWNV